VSSGAVFNLSDKPHGISFPSTKPSNASNLPSFSKYIMTDPDVEEHRRHLTFIDTSVHSDRDGDSQEIKSNPCSLPEFDQPSRTTRSAQNDLEGRRIFFLNMACSDYVGARTTMTDRQLRLSALKKIWSTPI
jgi:hypothetical protein